MISGSLSFGVARVELSQASSTVYSESITVFDHEISDWPHPAVTTLEIPCNWQVIACDLEYTAYSDPNDPYLRAMAFYLDDRGGGIGCYRIGPGQIRGWTISPGQTLHRVFDMSYVMFPLPDEGGEYLNFIPEGEGYIPGYFSPGVHDIEAFVTSQYPGAVQESWISIILHFQYIVVPILATIDFDPDTLNLKSHGNYVTVYIELTSECGLEVSDIDPTTVSLNGLLALEKPTPQIGDHDGDGFPDLMVKFDRQALKSILMPGDPVLITVSGECSGGIPFEGTDTIRVIH